jgi:uncharacterized protein (DUF2236 family)
MAVPASPPARSRQRVEPVPFGPGSLLWDLAGDRRGNLVFLMPTLMQAMHPVIGDALARRPVGITDPWGRLIRSLDSIHLWIYGGDEAIAEGRRLIELHKPVRGRDASGQERSALSPEVWAWVVLSAYPALLTQCDVFGEPLGPAGRRRLYAEVQNLARILGVRDRHIPPSTEEFWAYYQEMISTRLVDHPYVHRVLATGRAAPVPPGLPRPLHPLWHVAWEPVGRLGAWIISGTFPPEVRTILGISWTARDQRCLHLFGQAVRYSFRYAPEAVRYPATPRLARRLAQAQATGRPTAALHERLATRITHLHARNTKSLV